MFLFICGEREEEGEKEGKKHHCVRDHQLSLAGPQLGTRPATQVCALTGNQTSDLPVHRPELNPLSHTSRGYLYHLIREATMRTNKFGKIGGYRLNIQNQLYFYIIERKTPKLK